MRFLLTFFLLAYISVASAELSDDTITSLKNNPAEQFNLGWMFFTGNGVKQDYKKAVMWYEIAAKGGSIEALQNLAVIYRDGTGVERDYVESFKWFHELALTGSPVGQHNVAEMYRGGYGVKQDNAKAVEWYQKSADQGIALSQHNLAVMYEQGMGVKQNYSKALEFYQKAADQGNVKSIESIGLMYEKGLGVTQDYTKALALYKQANSDWSNSRYKSILRMQNCTNPENTKLFDVALICASRDDLMVAVKNGGAGVIREDKNKWGDSYSTSNVLKGSTELNILYTVDDFFAKAEYTFPSRMDSNQIVQVRDFVAKKYGQPDSSSGSTSVGSASFEWYLDDGITLKVNRGWPDTTTYLSYIFPGNYQAMIDEQERQRKEREAKEYSKQSNAF